MSHLKSIRHEEMGELNEYLVLEYLHTRRSSTRPQIAIDLNLSQASVSRIVAKLLTRDLIVESLGSSESSGRPRGILEINLFREAVIGIDLGGTRCHGVLSNLDGKTLDEVHISLVDAKNAYDALMQVWKTLVKKAKKRKLSVAALAVGVPAVVDPIQGIATRGPNIGWENFNLFERIRAFGVPFLVDNDVNLAASAEGEFGQARGVQDYVVLSLGTGFGGAIVSDGRLLRGHNHAAGEVASLLPNLSMLHENRMGSIGGMESILTGKAIEQRARQLAEENPALKAELGENPSPKTVIGSALAGGFFAQKIMNDVLNALASVVITLSAILDPELIVLDGSVGRAMAPFLEDIETRIKQHLLTPPRLAISQLGHTTTVSGAVVAALRLFRSQEASETVAQLLQKSPRRQR